MENRKLISMVEYVNREVSFWDTSNRTGNQFALNCEVYANFLQETLTLRMFVPCGEDGKVLKRPSNSDYRDWDYQERLSKERDEYQEAEKRVIFEGFEVRSHDFQHENEVFVYNFRLDLHLLFNSTGNILTIGYETIEKLNSTNDLTLTQSKYDELFK